jgi:hypothetical protein
MADPELIEKFVACFEKLDDMTVRSRETDPVGWELRMGDANEFGWFPWRAARKITDQASLDAIYAKLPARFPPLYEGHNR